MKQTQKQARIAWKNKRELGFRAFHIQQQLTDFTFRNEIACLIENVWSGLTTVEAADQRLRRFGMMLSRRAAQ